MKPTHFTSKHLPGKNYSLDSNTANACVINAQHPLRPLAEAFIAQRFNHVHGARISEFMPQLLAITAGNEIRAIAGVRDASQDALFLEHYLDKPVEQSIATQAWPDQLIERSQIAEIGNLASVDRHATLRLYPLLASYLLQHHYQWAVFTGCSSLQRMFGFLGLQTFALGRALQSRLPADQQNWGSYYEDNPQVMAGKVSGGYQVFNSKESQCGGLAA